MKAELKLLRTRMQAELRWQRHPNYPDARMPHRAHVSDAGMDFFAAEDFTIFPGEVRRIHTGICVAPHYIDSIGHEYLPYGYNDIGGWTLAALAWDKSGIGYKGITTLGGVIDEQYRGEVQIIIAHIDVKSVLNTLHEMIYRVAFQGERDIESNELIKKPTQNEMLIMLGSGITFGKGEKLAQLLIQRVELPLMAEGELTSTDRGDGGFGSTGK